NLLGPAGDWLAGELCQTFGSAVYVLLAAWFVLVLFLLMRKSWPIWACRLAGWVLLVPCAALAADHIGREWLPGSALASGGSVGAALRALLDEHIVTAGQIAVYSGVSFIALVLALDIVMLRLLAGMWQVVRACGGLLTRIFWPKDAKPKARRPKKLSQEDSSDI